MLLRSRQELCAEPSWTAGAVRCVAGRLLRIDSLGAALGIFLSLPLTKQSSLCKTLGPWWDQANSLQGLLKPPVINVLLSCGLSCARRESPTAVTEVSEEFCHICRWARRVRDKMVCLAACNISCVVVVSLPLNWWCVTNQVLEVIEKLVLYKRKGLIGGELELQSRQSSDIEPLFGARKAMIHLACS